MKIRVWNPSLKEMVYNPNQANIRSGTNVFLSDGEVIAECQNEQKHWVKADLMLFTGVRDKNEKDIYEGDIVECYRNNPNSLVEFRNGAFGVMTNGVFDPFHILYGEVEVVGNKYESN